MSPVTRLFVVLLLLLVALDAAAGQSCPAENGPNAGDAPEPSTLHGKLVFHNDLRGWLGLKLDNPACGDSEIQLAFNEANERRAMSLRGCKVTAAGKIFETATGYWSARLAITDAHLLADQSCKPHPLLPDYSKATPRELKSYYAEITVDYKHQPVQVAVWADRTKQKKVAPSHAYIHASFSGAPDVLWIRCAEGFVASSATQNPPGELTNEGTMVGPELRMDRVTTVKVTCKRTAAK